MTDVKEVTVGFRVRALAWCESAPFRLNQMSYCLLILLISELVVICSLLSSVIKRMTSADCFLLQG